MSLKTIAKAIAYRLKVFITWVRYLIRPQSLLPENISTTIKLSGSEIALLVDPWYHDFEVLGFKTHQRVTKGYREAQEAKQGPLFEFTAQAITLCRKQGTFVKGVELFCADGFFTNYAIQCGAQEVYGIDIDDRELSKARLITKLLGNSKKVRFDNCDVFGLDGTYDFGICAGGLYHISNPHDLLKLLSTKIKTALVVQTVYSLANESEEYFEAPVPPWTWGCRFSYKYLLQMVKDAGWNVLHASKNELRGNKRLQDRGSAYLLCVPIKNNCA